MSRSVGSLDTNVVLRLILNDAPAQHLAALKLFHDAGGRLAVSDAAIIETVFVLCRGYDFTRQQAKEAIEGLMIFRELNCNRALFEEALPIFADHPGLSFEDCCMAVYAELNQAEPLWTFDKKLATQVSTASLIGS